MVHHFPGIAILHHLHWLLHNAVEGLDHLNYFFNYLLLHNFHFNHFTHYALHWYDFLLDDFHFADLRHCVVHDLLNDYWLLNFNYSLDYHLNLDNLRNLHYSFHHLLDDSGNFHNFFRVLRYFHHLLDHVINILDHLNWHMDDLFHFLNLHDFNWFFHYSLNSNHLWYLHNSFNHFFHYFLNLNDLGDHSEDLQDVIHINHSHNFLVDHANHALIDVKHCAVSAFQLLKLLKKGLNEHSQVELNSAALFGRVGVDVLHAVELRHVLNDRNNSLEVVGFQKIDDLLLEELGEANVSLVT